MKYASKGLLLAIAIAGVDTTITQLTAVGFPDGTVGTWRSTCLETPGPSHTYQVSDYVDEGDMTASGFYDPSEATHGVLQGLRATPAVSDWTITLPSGLGTWAFSGILTKFTPKGAIEEALMFDMTVKVSGNITYP